MSDLSPADVREFERRLRERRDALREIIRAELLATRREEYLELAGQVHDIGDESIAELLMGVDLAGRARELTEMQDIEAALTRIERGTFGVCTDCHSDVTRERLEVYPTAKRCLICQQRYEQRRNGGKDGSPSL
jgi:RNA polymerase-binding transcription factor DksA